MNTLKKIALAALSAGAALTSVTAAHAAEGCGPGWRRNDYGACRPSYRAFYGPAPGPVYFGRPYAWGPGYYHRGYWRRRYW